MKRKIYAFAALLAAGCSSQPKEAQPSIFEGKFIGYNDEFVEFFMLSPDGNYAEVPVKVAEDGTFCDTLKFGTVYDCALFADKFMFRTCIEEGKHYVAEFDLTTGTETDFRFTGDGEKENLFLSHYWSGFRTMESLLIGLRECDTFEAYMEGVDNVAKSLQEELSAIDNKPFVKYYQPEFNRLRNTYINCYPLMRVAASGTYRPEKSYLAAVKAAPKLSDKDFTYMVQNIGGYIPYLFPNMNLREGLRAVADYSDKKARKDEAVTALISSFVLAGCNGQLKDAYEYYKENVSDIDEDLCRKIEGAISLGPGVQAPEIEFEDINGNKLHLADFQGKPLYIDLWASWCGPCCEEIPHLQKLVDALGENPEIVCISISIDDNKNDWTAKLAQENSTWPQYIATAAGQEAIAKDYGVSSIPRFLLINPDGTIASINAPRPSSNGIIESLNELL